MFTNRVRQLIGKTVCRRSRSLVLRAPVEAENLEVRVLPTVVWANQGNDQFNTFYGANAQAARNIVNHAIQDWNTIIVSSTTLNLNISAAAFTGGVLGATTNIVSSAGRPISATIQMDDNAAGAGWFLDATITDDSEFSNLATGFSGASPGMTMFDFYRTITHEIGHALGLSQTPGLAINQYLTASGTNQVTFYNPTGTFQVTEVLSTNTGLHTTDSNDIMSDNALPGVRRLISDKVVRILRDAYGYGYALPSTVDNLHVNAHAVAGNVAGGLTVTPGAGAFNDSIALDRVSTSQWRVVVNGLTERVNHTSVSGARQQLTLNGGDGNDTISVSAATNDFVEGVTVNGGNGTDTGIFYQTPTNTNQYGFYVSGNSVFRNYLFVGPGPYGDFLSYTEQAVLVGTANGDTHIIAGNSFTSVRSHGLGGDDNILGSGPYLGYGANYVIASGTTPILAFGGDGNDTIRGGGGGDILLGNGGNDTITGAGGRDLIIGGVGTDTINAQNAGDEDIAIGSSTSHDTNLNALIGIFNEWNSTRTRAQRIANLSGTGTGTRLNSNFFLIANSTVLNDNLVDSLFQDLNLDWTFF